MSILIPLNIIFALIFYPMFISNYHRKEPYLLNLFIFLINAIVSLYSIFIYFGLLK